MEAWSVAGREMEDFKQEVRSEIREMSKSIRTFSEENARSSARTSECISELTGVVKALAESDIRRQEREDRQQETNSRIIDDVKVLKEFREDIIVSRAKESPARDWLSKNYPWLVVIAALATAYISKFPIK